MPVPALPAILAAIILLPMPAVAQYRCTMPSGAVIYSRLSPCPKDATLSERVDHVPEAIPAQAARPKTTPAAPLVITPDPRPITAAPKKADPGDILAQANAICSVLRAIGATTCEVNVNIFSPSYIDATVPTTPNDARMACLNIASITRQPGSPFIGRSWRLKLFSPMGSGTRPIAECNL